MITLTIQKAAQARGIETQLQLIEAIKEKTGVVVRPATISELYRNKSKDSINKKHLLLVMRALEISDFNEIMAIEE